MDFLPLFVSVKGKQCLVVGGDNLCARKAELVHRAGARIHVVAKSLCDELSMMVANNQANVIAEAFELSLLQEHEVIIVGAVEHRVKKLITVQAEKHNKWVNFAEDLANSTAILPSVIDRSPVIVAVSTGAVAPFLARMLRGRLEAFIPAGYGRLATIIGSFRKEIKSKIKHLSKRRHFWESIFDTDVPELVYSGEEQKAKDKIKSLLDNQIANDKEVGEVYLVGAGPGDPDLLTFRALRLMQQADVVIFDRLVAPAVVDLARRDAKRIYVGKKQDAHTVPQEGINDLLVDEALKGYRVLRLKGGDPFVFGRGGEEIDTLMEKGIRFQVVPGITSALGCSSYSGIPLTHRDYAQSVEFITGHLKGPSLDIDWASIAKPHKTLVFYMGLRNLGNICENLMNNGLSSDMPVALVQKGTTPEQKVVVSDLGNAPDSAQNAALESPTLIIVGEVVKLRDKLNWLEANA
jgi:uroporphyrin-III C-methyltransferase/precorrin-2 dehydrogenase/sirohydrochlorin ferrochelatase